MTASKLHIAGAIVIVLVCLFVFAPAVVILFDSLNSASSFPAPFESVTFRWYAEILNHSEFMTSARESVFIAASAAVVSSVIGVLAGYALVRYRLPGKDAIATFLVAPLLVPQIVIGLAILQVISLLGFEISPVELIAAHIVYVLPFTLRLAMTSLARFDFALEEAARSLGAGRWQTFRYVILPLIRPGLTSGFVFAFILSFVNLPTSLFLTSPATATLPIVMFSYMEASLDPMIAAVASAILISALVATVVAERVFRIRLLS